MPVKCLSSLPPLATALLYLSLPFAAYSQGRVVLDLRKEVYSAPVFHEVDTIVQVNRGFVIDSSFSGRGMADTILVWVEFDQPVNFELCVFLPDLKLSRGMFLGGVGLKDCAYGGNAEFSSSHFTKAVEFSESKFYKDLVVQQAVFDSVFEFLNDTVVGNADLSGAYFNKGSSFALSMFDKRVDLSHSTLSGKTEFVGAVFGTRANFNDVILGNSGSFDFSEAALPDTLDFSDIPVIPNEIDLLAANFSDTSVGGERIARKSDAGIHYINLYHSDIRMFRIDYLRFRLLLKDPNTGKDLSRDEAKTVYESLLKNFKDRGQEDSYESLDVEYNDYKWKHSSYALFRWFWVVPHYWNHYGYSKGLIFLWAGLFLVLFTIITFFRFDRLNDKETGVYNIESLPDRLGPARGIRALADRLWYSVMYTFCIFFMLRLKIEKVKFEHKGDTFYLIIVYTVGLICLGYMANFVLQK